MFFYFFSNIAYTKSIRLMSTTNRLCILTLHSNVTAWVFFFIEKTIKNKESNTLHRHKLRIVFVLGVNRVYGETTNMKLIHDFHTKGKKPVTSKTAAAAMADNILLIFEFFSLTISFFFFCRTIIFLSTITCLYLWRSRKKGN